MIIVILGWCWTNKWEWITGKLILTGEARSSRRRSVSMPNYSPQIPQILAWIWIRASTVTGTWRNAWEILQKIIIFYTFLSGIQDSCTWYLYPFRANWISLTWWSLCKNPNFTVLRTSTSEALLCTYLLTSWSRVLLEKLTCLQLVKKFPIFYGTRRFITLFTIASHLSLSWASLI
jgi:hypothetical protein